MKSILKYLSFIVLVNIPVAAQQATFQDALLDRMTGKWVLEGTIGGQKTTHDIVTDWVLGHQYIQIHETSREKNAQGGAAYEAIVYIGWDEPTKTYACLWLDVTGGGGLTGQAIAHGARSGDRVAFVFKLADGSAFHTTFVFDRDKDTWQWLMDGEEDGKVKPFARVLLSRR